MRAADVYSMALRALKDRKLRSALTILGITIGSALIVALVASTGGLTASVSKQIEKIGITTITISSTSPRFQITDEDVIAVRGIPGVKDVIPYISRRLSLNYGSSSLSVSLFGIEQGKIQSIYKGLALSRGTLADEYDPTGVIIGSAIANPPSESFPPLGVNEMLILQGGAGSSTSTYSFIVKGILAPYGAAGFLDIDEAVFMSLTGARLLFRSAYYSGLYVIAESADAVDSVVASLQNYYGSSARISSPSALLSTAQSVTTQLTYFLGSIAAVSLFVAGVGIANTMYISVVERTREIGILKAIGYRPRQILSLFLAEAAVTGMIGGLIGTSAGVLLSFLLSGNLPFGFRVPGIGFRPGQSAAAGASFSPALSAELVLFSLTFPVAIAILAGLYPAWRASRMDTVIALKYE
ncbi:MAG: FtsX-like permease family protein [Candidatus Bathyarchaeia archaeon]